jgi:hypothetical protein
MQFSNEIRASWARLLLSIIFASLPIAQELITQILVSILRFVCGKRGQNFISISICSAHSLALTYRTIVLLSISLKKENPTEALLRALQEIQRCDSLHFSTSEAVVEKILNWILLSVKLPHENSNESPILISLYSASLSSMIRTPVTLPLDDTQRRIVSRSIAFLVNMSQYQERNDLLLSIQRVLPGDKQSSLLDQLSEEIKILFR